MTPSATGTGLVERQCERLRNLLSREFLRVSATHSHDLISNTTELPRTRRPRLWRDRRGAVSAMFGLAAMAFFGLVGMATEAGSWYLAHRNGQNAADAAAIAGAWTLALSSGNDSSTETAVRNTATKNGFTTGGSITVTPNHPPSDIGLFYNDNDAVEAIIDQLQASTFSNWFGQSQKTIRNRAVARIFSGGNACVLALTAGLTINGGITLNSPNCALASNMQGPDSIDLNGGAMSGTVASMTAVGECDNCPNGLTLSLGGTPTSYGTPTVNPFQALDSQVWPVWDQYTGPPPFGNGNHTIGGGNPLLPSFSNGGPNNGGHSYRNKNLTINSGDIVEMEPGIYIFDSSTINVVGGSLTCPNCTNANGIHIVQFDSTFSVGGGAVVSLSAGNTVPSITGASPNPPSLTGILYYNPNGSTGGQVEASLNGGATQNLMGGIYVPNGDLQISGNPTSTCSIAVAGTVTISGDTLMAHAGCPNIGTPYTTTRTIALVE